MNAPFVCATCFRKLLRPNHHLRNASFVSLGTLVNRDDGSKAQIQQKTASADSEEPVVKDPANRKRKTYAQQYEEQRRPKGVDKVLETLFSSNRAQEHASQVSRYSRTPKIHRVEEVVETKVKDRLTDLRLLELHNLLRRGTSGLQYIWASCLELFDKEDWRRERRPDEVEGMRHDAFFYDLLMAVCAQQRLSVNTKNWTPATVIETLLKQGVMRYWWHRVIWYQLRQLMELRHGGIEKTAEAIEKEETQTENLLEVWSLFTRLHCTLGPHINIVVKRSRSSASLDESLEARFRRLMRDYPDRKYSSSMAAAGITTVEYLGSERIKSSQQLGRESSHLLARFLSELRRGIDPYLTVTQRWLAEVGTSAEVVDSVMKRLDYQHVHDKHDIPVWKRDELGERKPRKTYDWGKVASTKRLGEIDKAFRHADAEDTVNLWENFVQYLEDGRPKNKDTNSEIYAKFLSTFWSLRCSKEALLVWNYMVNSGQLPAQIHWNAMLSGCAAARDAKSMQDIWRNMLRSKFEPDIGTWTTYIHSLIKLWKWEEGLKALQSLGRTWEGKPAAGTLSGKPTKPNNSDRYDASVPNIAPVHGALSALTDIKKPELHATVIAWAESYHIPLETHTFNILLQPIVRHGTQAQVQSHLEKMAAHNCPPDIFTFTIILQGLVSNRDSTFHALSPSDQENTIMTTLHDMEAHNIPADAHTYTILLDALLSPKSWKTDPHLRDASDINTLPKQSYNVPAARTILRHMQSRSLVPSPHHYVILVNHYFSRTPPDLAAVGTLWHGIRHSGQTQKLDDLFYDRMIEGYADHDEIEKALEFLRVVPQEGKRPSWWALYRVLAALDRGREWDLCRELMEDVEDPRELFRHGQGLFRGKRQFYELVDVLRGQGVMMGGAEQI